MRERLERLCDQALIVTMVVGIVFTLYMAFTGSAHGAEACPEPADHGGGVTVASPGVDLGSAVVLAGPGSAPRAVDVTVAHNAARRDLEAALRSWGRWLGVADHCRVRFNGVVPAGFPWGAEYVTSVVEPDGDGGITVVHVYWRED